MDKEDLHYKRLDADGEAGRKSAEYDVPYKKARDIVEKNLRKEIRSMSRGSITKKYY